MQAPLLATALLMGVAGGPHCVAMCGAACAGAIRLVRAPVGGVASLAPAFDFHAAAAFHAGRIAGYAVAGAVAAVAVQSLSLASAHMAALRPLWVLLHVAVLAWGVVLLTTGRQPLWAHRIGRSLAARLRTPGGSAWRVFAAGAVWIAMPCGLLYSALMLAALGNGPVHGALAMTAFALGSGVSLLLAPWLWQRLRWQFDRARQSWGTRIAGAALAAVAGQAVWMDLARQIAIWCA